MKPTLIYALIDPTTGQAKYVGKTLQTIEKRLAAHLCAARGNTHTYSARWLSGLLKQGLVPEVDILEIAHEDWQEAESFWIANLRFMGCDLTNHTAGGDGLASYNHTETARLNMSIAQKKRYELAPSPLLGVPRPEDVRLKLSASQKGRVISQEHREKIAATLRGRTLPQEVIDKVAAAHRGMKRPPRSAEHSAKHAAALRGKAQSAEHKAKISVALRGVPKSEEHRRKLSEAAFRRYRGDKVTR